MMMLSAISDEISPDLQEQLAVLRAEGIHFLELRSVWETNVLDLTDGQLKLIMASLREAGIRVSAIASPIGKVGIDEPIEEHLKRFDRAVTVARYCETAAIRVF